MFVCVSDMFVCVSDMFVCVSDMFVCVSDVFVCVSDVYVYVSGRSLAVIHQSAWVPCHVTFHHLRQICTGNSSTNSSTTTAFEPYKNLPKLLFLQINQFYFNTTYLYQVNSGVLTLLLVQTVANSSDM